MIIELLFQAFFSNQYNNNVCNLLRLFIPNLINSYFFMGIHIHVYVHYVRYGHLHS